MYSLSFANVNLQLTLFSQMYIQMWEKYSLKIDHRAFLLQKIV
jgi:hypothetical protein